MRRLGSRGGEEPLATLYADLAFPAPEGRPFVFAGMVSSVDGVSALQGVSGGLGGEADLQAFRALRAAADAVLVGAGTVRAEDYRGVRLPESVVASRREAGRADVPPVVVVTSRVDLDPGARLFHDTSIPPWLVVPDDAAEAALRPFHGLARIVRAGRGRVDLPTALAALHAAGLERVLCEGGPSLLAQLLNGALVDELFLTIAPVLAGRGPRLVGEHLGARMPLSLREARVHGDDVLLRLAVPPT